LIDQVMAQPVTQRQVQRLAEEGNGRFRIREEARAKGIWPPPSGGGPYMIIRQENMLVVPAAFSPLH
jgi:hypothetical protein